MGRTIDPAALLASALLVLPLGLGDDDAVERTIVQLPANWSVGTTFDVTVEKGRRDSRDGVLEKEMRSTSRVTVEVVEASGEGFVFRWTYTDVVISGPSEQGWLGAGLGRLLEGVVLDLDVDAFGSVTGLRTQADATRVDGDPASPLDEATDLPPSDEPAVTTNLPTMLTAGLADGVIEEARMFTLPAGGEYAVGEKQSYVDMLPFPFTEERIPTEASFHLVDVDDEEGTALLIWRQVLDAEESAEVVGRFLESVASLTGRSGEASSMDHFVFDIRDEARYSYELATGLPWWMSSSRTTRVDDRTRVDWMRITRHEND